MAPFATPSDAREHGCGTPTEGSPWSAVLCSLLLLVLAAPAPGQEERTGAVQGRLTQQGPLVGAVVTAPGTGRRDTTEFCPDTAEIGGRGAGALRGRVVHRDDGRPLRQVRVRVAWADSGTGPDGRAESRLVRTDTVGRFTVCGIPPGSTVQALVGTGAYGQRTEPFRMSEDGFLVRRIAYSVPNDTTRVRPESVDRAAIPALPDSAPTVLPPLTVPIQPEGFLSGFRRRRESREGYFLTREEIAEADPAVLPQVFQKGSYPAVRVGTFGETLRLFDSDSPKRMWCEPHVVIDGRLHRWGTPPVWHEPESVLALEVYWYDEEVPSPLREGPSPDLRRLDAEPPTFQGGDGRMDMSETVMAPDCGAILIWTQVEAEPE